jgi:surfactin synthase thioesterase subunit
MSDDRWINRFAPSDEAPVRLVCFPHAGGSSSFFFPVSRALAPAIDVLAVQYPGRQDRRLEPCLPSVGALADGIARSLRAFTDRPTAFFGHSMGALVAFEVARRVPRAPVHLIVSGRRAPSRWRAETVHQRDDPGLLAELAALGGTDQRFFGDEELLRLMLPTIRADYRAVETYRPAPDATVTCPVTALVGDTDPRVTVDEADAWRAHTTDRFDLHVLTGGHFYLVHHQREITDLIARGLGVMTAKERTFP